MGFTISYKPLSLKHGAQIVFLAVCVLVLGLGQNAFAQDRFNRNAEIAQQDIPERQVFGGFEEASENSGMDEAPAPRPNALSPSYQNLLEQRINDLEQQLRELTGKVEKLQFENTQIKNNLEKAQADSELRIQALENTQKAQTPAMPTDAPSSLKEDELSTEAPTEATKPNDEGIAPASSPTTQKLGTLTKAPNGAAIEPLKTDPAKLYEEAYATLKAGDAAAAQKKFNSFLKDNPTHPLRPNATYWLGETFFAQGNFAQSTRVFAESYKKFPKGPKAADSLLKMGLSLSQNSKPKEACVTFKQLKKEFPASPAPLLRRADAEMTKLSC